jgi:hypothetical protein
MTCRHTKQPEGYLQWHNWAEGMSVSHIQKQCPHCGLWAIWERKKSRQPISTNADGLRSTSDRHL